MSKEVPRFRCSEIDRLIRCPGSRSLIEKVSEYSDTETSVATVGKAIHQAVAQRFVDEEGADVGYDGIGEPIAIAESDRWMVDYCYRSAIDLIPDDYAVVVEDTMEADMLGRFFLTGHVDLYCVNEAGTIWKGWDWKTGQIMQDSAESNMQALGYLVLAYMSFPDLEYAEFRIVQPRASLGHDDERISTVTLSGAELQSAHDYLCNEIIGAIQNSDLLRTGVKQCQYCKAQYQCPAIKKEREAMELRITNKEMDELSNWSSEDFADLAAIAKVLHTVCDNVLKEAKQRVIDGEELTTSSGETFSVKSSPGVYKVIDPDTVWEVSTQHLGDYMPQCFKPSVSEVKNSLAKAYGVPKKSKDASKESAETLFKRLFGDSVEQQQKQTLQLIG